MEQRKAFLLCSLAWGGEGAESEDELDWEVTTDQDF
jgi:hypothetical protein